MSCNRELAAEQTFREAAIHHAADAGKYRHRVQKATMLLQHELMQETVNTKDRVAELQNASKR